MISYLCRHDTKTRRCGPGRYFRLHWRVLQPYPTSQPSRWRQSGGLRKGLAVRTETVYGLGVTPHLKCKSLSKYRQEARVPLIIFQSIGTSSSTYWLNHHYKRTFRRNSEKSRPSFQNKACLLRLLWVQRVTGLSLKQFFSCIAPSNVPILWCF